mgnify:CR=1 FL=1
MLAVAGGWLLAVGCAIACAGDCAGDCPAQHQERRVLAARPHGGGVAAVVGSPGHYWRIVRQLDRVIRLKVRELLPAWPRALCDVAHFQLLVQAYQNFSRLSFPIRKKTYWHSYHHHLILFSFQDFLQ